MALSYWGAEAGALGMVGLGAAETGVPDSDEEGDIEVDVVVAGDWVGSDGVAPLRIPGTESRENTSQRPARAFTVNTHETS